MTAKDSCHWMVKTKCGIPKYKIKKMGSDWITKSRLTWVEYQKGVSDVKIDTTSNNLYPAPDKATVFEDLTADNDKDYGTLGLLKLGSDNIDVLDVEKEYKAQKKLYDDYTKEVEKYVKDAEDWNAKVDAFTAKVVARRADPNAADPNPPPDNSTKPKLPTEPKNLTKYTDFLLNKTTPVKGWGKPSKGTQVLATTHGSFKYFGTLG